MKLQKAHLVLAICFSVNFVVNFVQSQVAPFYPSEAQSRGLNETEVGIVFGIQGMMSFVFSFPFGVMLQRTGRKKMLIFGMIIETIMIGVFGLLDNVNDHRMFLWMSLCIRGTAGAAGAAAGVAMLATLSTQFPDRVSTMVGTAEVFSGLGYMCGPPIGALLFSAGGFRLPFFSVSGIFAALVLLVIFVLPNDSHHYKNESSQHHASNLGKGMLECLNWRIIITAFGGFSCAMGFSFLEPVAAPYLTAPPLNFSIEQTGLLFFLCAGMYGIFAPITGYMADRIGTRFVICIFECFGGLGFLFAGPCPAFNISPSVLQVCLALVSLGGGTAGGISTCAAEMIRILGEDKVDYISGIMNAAFSLGSVTGPVGGSLLLQHVFHNSFQWTSTLIGGILIFHGMLVGLVFAVDVLVFKDSVRGRKKTETIALPITAEDDDTEVYKTLLGA